LAWFDLPRATTRMPRNTAPAGSPGTRIASVVLASAFGGSSRKGLPRTPTRVRAVERSCSVDGTPGSEIMWPDPRFLGALLKAGIPVVAKVGPVVVRARVGVADEADLLDLLVAIFDWRAAGALRGRG
jgi:hypothetical protein